MTDTALDTKTGIRSRIRAELARIADDMAAKSTRVAVILPGAEIAEAMHRIFADIPRIPDYDPDAAATRVWCNAVDYVPDEIPSDPAEISVQAGADLDTPTVDVTTHEQDVTLTIPLDLDQAEEFFLAGLAAVSYLRVHGNQS